MSITWTHLLLSMLTSGSRKARADPALAGSLADIGLGQHLLASQMVGWA